MYNQLCYRHVTGCHDIVDMYNQLCYRHVTGCHDIVDKYNQLCYRHVTGCHDIVNLLNRNAAIWLCNVSYMLDTQMFSASTHTSQKTHTLFQLQKIFIQPQLVNNREKTI